MHVTTKDVDKNGVKRWPQPHLLGAGEAFGAGHFCTANRIGRNPGADCGGSV